MGKKESTSRDILDIIIKNEEIEKVFEDEEWRENVADAAFIAALYTTPLNEDPKEIFKSPTAGFSISNTLFIYMLPIWAN